MLWKIFAVVALLGGAGPEVKPPAPTDPAVSDVGLHFLLLDNDKVVEGEVEKTPTGYTLSRHGGSVFFPERQVVTAAASKHELYLFKKGRFPHNDLDEQHKLHRWCLINGLKAESRAQLEIIQELNPDDEAVDRAMRAKSRQAEKKGTSATAKHRVPAAPAKASIDNFIAGHGAEAFQKYVVLEKLLVNRCASSGCHGSDRHAGDFRLFRHGKDDQFNPKFTSRNLETVLRFVDLKQPRQSKLLEMALEKHGQSSVAPFGGVNDPKYRELKDWVFSVSDSWSVDHEAVAKDGTHRRGRKSSSPMHSEGVFAQDDVPAAEIPDRFKRPEHRPERRPASTAASKPTVGRSGFGAAADDAPEDAPAMIGPPVRRPAVKTRPKDPFDPSAFNKDLTPPKLEEEPKDEETSSNDEEESPREKSAVPKPDSTRGPTVEWGDSAPAPEVTMEAVTKGAALSPTNRFGKMFRPAPFPFGFRKGK